MCVPAFRSVVESVNRHSGPWLNQLIGIPVQGQFHMHHRHIAYVITRI